MATGKETGKGDRERVAEEPGNGNWESTYKAGRRNRLVERKPCQSRIVLE